MGLVQGRGINDMYWGWASENEWNRMVYQKWHNMLVRCYNEEYHKTDKGKCYVGCTVCDRWLVLSNFVEDVRLIDGYDEERFLNGELVLDKDIKSRKRNKKNKQYIMVECLLTTQAENTKEANRAREYHELSEETKQKISEAKQGENNPMYGKHHTDESKQKISEAKKGKFGSEHPKSRRIAQYDKVTLELIKIWDSMHDVERELGIDPSSISRCCKGKQKSAGGCIWKYLEDE